MQIVSYGAKVYEMNIIPIFWEIILECYLLKFLPGMLSVNPSPAEPGYTMPLQTV